ARSWLGELDEALEFYETARLILDELGNEHSLAVSRKLAAQVLMRRAEWEPARGLIHEAMKFFERSGDEFKYAQMLHELGDLELRTKNLDAARSLMRQALKVGREYQSHMAISDCTSVLGDIARYRGDLDEAQKHHEEALQSSHFLHAQRAVVPQINLAIIQVERGNYEGARWDFEFCLRQAQKSGRRMIEGFIYILILPCLAAAELWERFDESIEAGEQIVEDLGIREQDLARAARLAGKLAQDAGQPERARRAFGLADDQAGA
ncbi:MAG: tetratricopeptide repeat protein, partial [Bradymonadaceae bacterium]